MNYKKLENWALELYNEHGNEDVWEYNFLGIELPVAETLLWIFDNKDTNERIYEAMCDSEDKEDFVADIAFDDEFMEKLCRANLIPPLFDDYDEEKENKLTNFNLGVK